MDHMEGQVIAGDFDDKMNVFSIHRFKEFYIQSQVNQSQLNSLYQYLKKHEDDPDGQVVTLYDQMPILLTQSEIQDLLEDIEKIKTLCKF